MGDYAPANIVFPSKFFRGKLADRSIDRLEDTDISGNMVFGSSGEARNGCFEDLEDFLVEHGIPFDRDTDRDWGISEAHRKFRPAIGDEECIDSEIYEPYIGVGGIMEILKNPDENLRTALEETVASIDPSIISLEDWLVKYPDYDMIIPGENDPEDVIYTFSAGHIDGPILRFSIIAKSRAEAVEQSNKALSSEDAIYGVGNNNMVLRSVNLSLNLTGCRVEENDIEKEESVHGVRI